MAKITTYTEHKAEVIEALHFLGGPAIDKELAPFLGLTPKQTAVITKRMQAEGLLVWSEFGWDIPKPVVQQHSDGFQRFRAEKKSTALYVAEEYLAERLVLPDPRFLLPMALWACHTYCWRSVRFDLPYLFFTGVSGSGKNRAMNLVGALSHNFEFVSKSTEAALRDLVAYERPTLGVEECERELRRDGSYTHILFNAGFQSTGTFYKTVGGSREGFSVYCPKMATTISDPEMSLRTRCILVPMEIGSPAINDELAEAEAAGIPIAEKLKALVALHEDEIDTIYHKVGYFAPDDLLVGRDWQGWKPLYSICEALAPSRMSELRRCSTYITALKTGPLRTIKEMTALRQDNDLMLNCNRLVRDAAIVAAKTRRANISSEELRAGLLAMPHGWWQGFHCLMNGTGRRINDGQYGLQVIAKMFMLFSQEHGDGVISPSKHRDIGGVTKHGYSVAEIVAADALKGGKGVILHIASEGGKGVSQIQKLPPYPLPDSSEDKVILPPTIPQRIRRVE